MSNFSFSHNVFYFQIISSQFDIISLFAAEFEEPKIGISGKELNFTN